MRHFLKISTLISHGRVSNLQKLVTNRCSSLSYNTAAAAAAAADQEKENFTPSEKVVAIVDEISNLTLMEVADLSDVLRQKLNIQGMPAMAMMMPGMRFNVKGGFGAMGGDGAAEGSEKKVEKKAEEKTVYNLKLDGFDAAGKIKVIKEVRSFTSLGLKEAKELVEKAPTVMKSGVTKEEAEKIIEKMKEVGAKVSME